MSTSIGSKAAHLQILVKKHDGMGSEEFHTYWTTEHPKIWLSIPIVQSNVLEYTQFHVDGKVQKGLRAAGLPMASYDGGVQIWGRSLEELMAVFQDPEYLAKVVPDEEKFLKRSEALMMVGWDEEIWSAKGAKEGTSSA